MAGELLQKFGIDTFPTDQSKEYRMSDPVFGTHMQVFTNCELPGARGRTEVDETACCIYLSKDEGCKIGTLIHELFHGVHHMLLRRGIHIDNTLENGSSEECHAYLLQYYLNQMIEQRFFIENKRFKV